MTSAIKQRASRYCSENLTYVGPAGFTLASLPYARRISDIIEHVETQTGSAIQKAWLSCFPRESKLDRDRAVRPAELVTTAGEELATNPYLAVTLELAKRF